MKSLKITKKVKKEMRHHKILETLEEDCGVVGLLVSVL